MRSDRTTHQGQLRECTQELIDRELASFGLFLSVATRQSVAAVGGTLPYAMSLQGLGAMSAIKAVHAYLLTNQLTSWHDLFQTPVTGGAILRSLWSPPHSRCHR